MSLPALRPMPGRSSADAELQTITSGLAAKYDFNKNRSMTLVPLREELTGQVQRSLIVLYGAVAVLLTIACFNVANLLLARAASRRHEIAIRTSLGAGRLPIVRQLLVESVLLALGGGLLGLAVARWSIDGLLALAPAGLLRVSEVDLDWRVIVLMHSASLSPLESRSADAGVLGRETLARHRLAREQPQRHAVCTSSSGAGRGAGSR